MEQKTEEHLNKIIEHSNSVCHQEGYIYGHITANFHFKLISFQIEFHKFEILQTYDLHDYNIKAFLQEFLSLGGLGGGGGTEITRRY